MRHNFKVIEKKWQKKWEDAKVFEAQDFSDTMMFPFSLSFFLLTICVLSHMMRCK